MQAQKKVKIAGQEPFVYGGELFEKVNIIEAAWIPRRKRRSSKKRARGKATRNIKNLASRAPRLINFQPSTMYTMRNKPKSCGQSDMSSASRNDVSSKMEGPISGNSAIPPPPAPKSASSANVTSTDIRSWFSIPPQAHKPSRLSRKLSRTAKFPHVGKYQLPGTDPKCIPLTLMYVLDRLEFEPRSAADEAILDEALDPSTGINPLVRFQLMLKRLDPWLANSMQRWR